jgi:HTH-type transcriptional regulator/antitoxin HigA
MPNMTQGPGRSEADMTNLDVMTLAIHWRELAKTVFVPHTEAEYQRLVAFLDRLIDVVEEDKSHPLASLMELVGVLIERYEDEYIPELTSGT